MHSYILALRLSWFGSVVRSHHDVKWLMHPTSETPMDPLHHPLYDSESYSDGVPIRADSNDLQIRYRATVNAGLDIIGKPGCSSGGELA